VPSVLLLLLLVLLATPVAAQEVSPRTYANTPTGMNFLGFGYAYSEGDLTFDDALEVDNAKGSIHSVVARYVRTFGLLGQNAKLKVALPYRDGSWAGTVAGVETERKTRGLADLRVSIEWLFYGAEAMPPEEFERTAQSTIAGLRLTGTAPTGSYDNDFALNIGENRWKFIPELGIAHQRGGFTFEVAGGAVLYTDNDDFVGGRRLEQRPVGFGTAAVIYDFRPGVWLGAGVAYGRGGRTRVDGVLRDTFQENLRFALVASYAITRRQGISLVGTLAQAEGAAGAAYDSIALSYQFSFAGP
jgi:hypothetical protein